MDRQGDLFLQKDCCYKTFLKHFSVLPPRTDPGTFPEGSVSSVNPVQMKRTSPFSPQSRPSSVIQNSWSFLLSSSQDLPPPAWAVPLSNLSNIQASNCFKSDIPVWRTAKYKAVHKLGLFRWLPSDFCLCWHLQGQHIHTVFVNSSQNFMAFTHVIVL